MLRKHSLWCSVWRHNDFKGDAIIFFLKIQILDAKKNQDPNSAENLEK